MEKRFPLVSILIPCYNAEQWIMQSIESALNQTYPNKEVIVVDDGSTDGSYEIIKSFCGRIKSETKYHQGADVTRNRLLEISQGEWLQYLDADDYLKQDKILEQIEFSKSHIDVEIIYSPVIVEENFKGNKRTYLLEMPDKQDFYVNFSRWGPLQTSGILWKKSAILDVGGWKENEICHEHELILRLIQNRKKILLYDKANSVYRQWSESSFSRKDKIAITKRRMVLTGLLGQYLIEEGLLNKNRLYAINLSRFEVARSIYWEDRYFANKLIKQIKDSDKSFRPHSSAAPMLYKIIFFIFGFDATEMIAKYTRSLIRKNQPHYR